MLILKENFVKYDILYTNQLHFGDIFTCSVQILLKKEEFSENRKFFDYSIFLNFGNVPDIIVAIFSLLCTEMPNVANKYAVHLQVIVICLFKK